MFVRERDLTAIVDKARKALDTHPEFFDWENSATDTELRCVVSWPGDDRRLADLNLCLVHMPDA